MDTSLIGLDPLFSTNVKLFIKDVLALVPVENTSVGYFSFHDHIIRLTEICGIIVAVEKTSANIIYTVDDSSGTINCCLWRNALPLNYVPLEISTAVRVQGKIAIYEGAKQIIIYDIFTLEDPNEELLHYIQTTVLEAEYQKPYRLPDFIESNKELLLCQIDGEYANDDATFGNFANEVLNFLKENVKGTFDVLLPRKDPKLIQIAKEMCEQQNTKITDRSMLRLFEKAIRSLIDWGSVVKSKQAGNLLELVNVIEIQCFILELVSEELEKANHLTGGVRAEYIRMKLQDKYTNMNKKSIDRLLNELLHRGFLIATNYGEYKTSNGI